MSEYFSSPGKENRRWGVGKQALGELSTLQGFCFLSSLLLLWLWAQNRASLISSCFNYKTEIMCTNNILSVVKQQNAIADEYLRAAWWNGSALYLSLNLRCLTFTAAAQLLAETPLPELLFPCFRSSPTEWPSASPGGGFLKTDSWAPHPSFLLWWGWRSVTQEFTVLISSLVVLMLQVPRQYFWESLPHLNSIWACWAHSPYLLGSTCYEPNPRDLLFSQNCYRPDTFLLLLWGFACLYIFRNPHQFCAPPE